MRTKSDHLVLRTDDALLRELESPEWGRPVALGAVFVRYVSSNLYVQWTRKLICYLNWSAGRSDPKAHHGPAAAVQEQRRESAGETVEAHRPGGAESVERDELGTQAAEGDRGGVG